MFNNTLFLLQIAVIVGFSRLVAAAFHRFGQPQVVGEMAAGIALGPTLFGLLAPHAYHSLFPPASLGFLNALSQIGLTVFMFLVGVRVDFAELRRQKGVAIVTSNISVILPLLMGTALAQYLYPRYGNGSPVAFALFIGTAMSVTAFPVLARILMERNLLGTRLGSVAIACAAVDDITAWVLLSVTVALATNDRSTRPVWLMFVYLAIYIVIMLMLHRALGFWSKRVDEKKLPLEAMVIFVVLALVSGAAGEWIGIHSLVGAFGAGLVTPRKFRQQLIDNLEAVTLLLLIPIFFVLTGIRTNLIFTIGAGAYLDLLLILLVAVASKWGGTMIGARAKGMGWRSACQLGLMMNTRGLVELIVLNVGLDSGILSPSLFSMMVCMALVTTLMATPLMDWVGGEKLKAAVARGQIGRNT
jgi:Kef-type K+ transport system membrane component KefB